MNIRFACGLLGVLCWLGGSGAALAGAGAWAEKEQVRARLLFGDFAETAAAGERWIVGGVHFRMQPGWKLSWRTPGDAGLALQHQTQGTKNLEDIQIHWPAPQRFVGEGGTETFGYRDEAVLPVSARVSDGAQPTTLALQLHFSVCEAQCVPVSLPLTMEMAAGEVADAGALQRIATYSVRIPREAESGMAYDIIWQEETEQGGTLKVKVSSSTMHFTVPDMLVEGADGVRFPRPRTVLEGDRRGVTFTLPYTLRAPGLTLGGQTLTFTLVNGYEAVQTMTTMPIKPTQAPKSN